MTDILQYHLDKTNSMEQILLIDDEIDTLDRHETILKSMGNFNIIKSPSIEDAEKKLKSNYFDFILSDHLLENGTTGLNFLCNNDIPKSTKILIITNFYDQAIYETYSKIRPIAFLKKNFQPLELFQLLSFTKSIENKEQINKVEYTQSKFSVKIGEKYKIIELEDIEYFEVDGKYLNLYSSNRKYNLRSSLTEILKKVPKNFLRVHGSYLLNMNKVISINPSDQTVELLNYTIPFSRNYKNNDYSTIYRPLWGL